jgi:hypothetical protein
MEGVTNSNNNNNENDNNMEHTVATNKKTAADFVAVGIELANRSQVCHSMATFGCVFAVEV